MFSSKVSTTNNSLNLVFRLATSKLVLISRSAEVMKLTLTYIAIFLQTNSRFLLESSASVRTRWLISLGAK